eukprot:572995-Pleurochrysis_carterae.AAC.2
MRSASMLISSVLRARLVLAEERQVQQNLQWLGVGGHHNQLGDSAVKRLCGCAQRWAGEKEEGKKRDVEGESDGESERERAMAKARERGLGKAGRKAGRAGVGEQKRLCVKESDSDSETALEREKKKLRRRGRHASKSHAVSHITYPPLDGGKPHDRMRGRQPCAHTPATTK